MSSPLRVLLYTEAFDPKVGGVVTSTRLLASYLHDQGVHVTVTTGTAGAGTRVYPFAVERCCPAERLQMLVRDTDVVHLQTF
ncbi:MAG TPA: hypothetical protein VM616_03065, partial [Gammaproteobacteria bacterium]|nr:hypothetical protein [Gammaproteobacteria bacterium]